MAQFNGKWHCSEKGCFLTGNKHSILIGLGIDGRKGMPGVFDGFPMEKIPTPLKLKDVKTYGNGAVWLRYLV